MAGETQEMMFGDVDPEDFGILVNWTYTQKAEDQKRDMSRFGLFAALWVLADRSMASKLASDTILAINTRRFECGGQVTSKIFGHIYDNTNDASPLRHSLIDFASIMKLATFEHDNYTLVSCWSTSMAP